MPPRDTETARRDAQKKRGTLGPDTNLGEAAVTRVRELLDRRGARGGSGSAPSSGRGATPAAPFPRGRARSRSAVDEVPEMEKPRRAAKKHASAHNARLLAAASAAADLATNSGKANMNTASVARDRNKNTRLEDAIRTCGAAAAGTIASLDRAAVAAVAADAHVAAVAAAAERGDAKQKRDAHRRDDDSVSLVSVSGDDAEGDSDADSADEWEDVRGDFDAYVALDDDEDDVEEKKSKSGKQGNGATNNRVSPADRECLKRMHETHLLCLVARAYSTDAAASDPLVKAMAVSAAPRGVAMDDKEDLRIDWTPPTIDRVAKVAKLFGGAFECRAFGDARVFRGDNDGRRPSGRDGNRKKKRPKPEPVSRHARVKVVDDVIVLDDEDDDEEKESKRAHSDSASTSMRSHLAAACASALVSPRTRLAFACARRRGTQEDLVGLFVAAARGLGLVARVVAAFDPTPHRASKSELAKLGVKVGGAEGDHVSDGGKRTSRNAHRPFRANAVKCDPSFFETANRPAPTDALTKERVVWWAEVLCLDESESEKKSVARGAEDAASNVSARWVPVVPHSAGVSKHAPRWSFKTGGSLVDDARALRGASPYVFAFDTSAHHERLDDFSRETQTSFRVVLTDVTRKYAEAFSKCVEKRVDGEWVAETTKKVSSSQGSHPVSYHSGHLIERLVSNANTKDLKEMEKRATTERVPSNMSELKNHPLYACERFLKPNQVMYPRKPIVGFVNGECVFPKSCVSELRSQERWKSEARREVLPNEIQKPKAWTHSRASRAALLFAERRKKLESKASAEQAADDTKLGVSSSNETETNKKRRRFGPRSVEEMARDLQRDAETKARAKADIAADDDDELAIQKKGDIPLFGVWQTREWVPPRAVNGVVPKNERGNVDLIGAHALPPPGTTHVVLPRILKVARALRDSRAVSSVTLNAHRKESTSRPFDFAPALIGFEYQRGGVVLPKFEGVVVCEEEEAALKQCWLEAEQKRLTAERLNELKKAKQKWRVLLSAVWTRVSLRDEFFLSDTTIEKMPLKDGDETMQTRFSGDDALHARALAGPATGLQPGRGAVVAGGADAEVEEM